MVLCSICRRVFFMSTHRGTLICLPAVRGKERNDRLAAHIGEIRGRLQGTVASVGASPLRVRRCVSYLELPAAVQSAVVIDLAHPMATVMLVLLDHHHGAFLLASGPAAHHDDIGTLLHHLEMLRESLASARIIFC